MEEYGRTDANNEGGERYGYEDEDFTGYPQDPGEPGDPYYDPTRERRAYSPGWTGAFFGVGALAGVARSGAGYFERPAWGPATGAVVQYNSLNQILDLHVSWRWARVTPTFNDGSEQVLTRNALDFSLGVHPLFISIIGGDLISYTVSNFSFNVGPSIDWTHFESRDTGEHVRFRTLGWHFGPSIGIPIDSPQDRHSVWAEIAWTYKNVPGDLGNPAFRRRHLHEHWLNLRISWRYNGNLGFGVRGPNPY